jgi:hypothetical protein
MQSRGPGFFKNFVECELGVLQFFVLLCSQGVLNKSQFVPQDVPNSTLFLSLVLCPKLSYMGGPKGRHFIFVSSK